MTDYWFIQLGPNYGGQAAVRISWDNEQLLPHELSVEYKTATDNTGIKPAVEHGGSYEGKKTSIFFHQLWFKKSSISHKSFYFVWWQWCIWHTLVCDSIKLLYHSDHNLSVVNIYFFFSVWITLYLFSVINVLLNLLYYYLLWNTLLQTFTK